MVSVVMTVGMLMLHRLMRMFVRVAFGQMQQHTRKHQQTTK